MKQQDTDLNSMGIKKNRYLELLHFCRQYQDWKIMASSYLGPRGYWIDGMQKGSGISDTVAAAAERREALTAKINLVERCANAVQDGAWSAALIQNICMGKSYDAIDQMLLPTSTRNKFFTARKEFFQLLDKFHR